MAAAAVLLTSGAQARADMVFWETGAVWEDVAVVRVTASSEGNAVLLRRPTDAQPSWYSGFRDIIITPKGALGSAAPALPPTSPPSAPQPQPPRETPPEPFEMEEPAAATNEADDLAAGGMEVVPSSLTFEDVRNFIEAPDSGSSQWKAAWDATYSGEAVQWSGMVVQSVRNTASSGPQYLVRQVVAGRRAPSAEDDPFVPRSPTAVNAETDVLVVFPPDTETLAEVPPGSLVSFVAVLDQTPSRFGALKVRGVRMELIARPPEQHADE